MNRLPFGFWRLVLAALCLFLSFGPAFGEAKPIKPGPAELQKLLADFEKYVEEGRQAWNVPGLAVAIVQDNEVIFAKGFGVRQVGGAQAVDENTIFQIGSTSKAFTAALVAMLADEEKVAWQDRVVDHLPDFRMYDPWVTREFTVEDLMAQRSGLPGYVGDGQGLMGFDRAHIIRTLRFLKPVSSFRSRYAYQNGVFLVPGALLEKHTGKTWEENVRERLLKPLGMSASSVHLDGWRKAKNLAGQHLKVAGKIETLPLDWPFHNSPYIYGPAGGINSNIMDMAKWVRFWLNRGKVGERQLISVENLDFLQFPRVHLGSHKGITGFYCLAWVYNMQYPYPLIWHTGGTTGHATMVALVPQAGLGLVVLSNLITPLPSELTHHFYDRYFGNPPRDWRGEMLAISKKQEEAQKIPKPAALTPPLSLERYTGTYRNDVYGPIEVAVQQDALVMTLGPKKIQARLKPWDRDAFQFFWPDMSDGSDEDVVVFQIGADGRTSSFFFTWVEKPEFRRVTSEPTGIKNK